MPLSDSQIRRSALVLAPLLLAPLLSPALVLAQEAAPVGTAVVIPPGSRPLQMTVRRLPESVDVVIEGVGTAPQLQQNVGPSGWQGRLTTSVPSVLRRGPQRLSLPEAGLQSIAIDGAGTSYRLAVTPVQGFQVNRPLVSADGVNLILSFPAPVQPSLQSLQPNLRQPGRVAQPVYAPPLQPRAVAPPVGDMAVGSMTIANPSYVNVSGPPVTMTTQNASARAVLLSLARMGGYGLAYIEDVIRSESKVTSQGGTERSDLSSSRDYRSSTASQGRLDTQNQRKENKILEQQVLEPPPITVSFRNEQYGRAFNTVLLVAGLQGKIEPGSRTIFVGQSVLGKTFAPQLSKVYRLNQVSSNSAADYLANLGASVSKTNVITTSVTQGVSQNNSVQGGQSQATTESSSQTSVESYGAATGPLVGLRATTDSRLSTITLVGSPSLVAVAEQYLKQLDLRQRQVALSVKILDVTLNNDKGIDNSFAFRYGNNFIVNDSGQLLGAFGSALPPTDQSFGRVARPDTSLEVTFENQDGVRVPEFKIKGETGTNAIVGAQFGTVNPVPNASGFYDATRRNPGLSYPENNFFDFVKAQIESRSTKVLASPTLILSENPEEIRKGDDVAAADIQSLSSGDSSSSSGGSNSAATIGRTKANEAYVTVGEQLITNYEVENGTNGNGNSCQPEFGIAGLTFGARVSKIDDNGFVTFSMSPAISAAVRQINVPGCGPIDILAIRRLDTGSARVRDGQTLILTGVISDSDSQIVTKWPILGDIPIVGQFFRSSGSNRAKRELVILVTPRIIDDSVGGTYGYGFSPTTQDARRLLGAGVN